MSINRVILSGNLTRDPELRSTSGGTSVLKLGLAVNERVKLNEEWTDRPSFVDVVMFGRRAEALSNTLARGAKVAIEGKLRYSAWETQAGEKRSKLEVVADEIEFMSRFTDAASARRAPSVPDDDDPEDIPF